MPPIGNLCVAVSQQGIAYSHPHVVRGGPLPCAVVCLGLCFCYYMMRLLGDIPLHRLHRVVVCVGRGEELPPSAHSPRAGADGGNSGGLWGAADVRPLPLLWGAGEPCLLAADAKPHVESSRHKSVFFFYWNVDFLLSPL